MQKIFHNNTKYKYFFNEDKEMLEKGNKICEKGNIILEKKDFIVRYYKYKKVVTSEYKFPCNTIPKESSYCICVSSISIDLVFNTDKNYYS